MDLRRIHAIVVFLIGVNALCFCCGAETIHSDPKDVVEYSATSGTDLSVEAGWTNISEENLRQLMERSQFRFGQNGRALPARGDDAQNAPDPSSENAYDFNEFPTVPFSYAGEPVLLLNNGEPQTAYRSSSRQSGGESFPIPEPMSATLLTLTMMGVGLKQACTRA